MSIYQHYTHKNIFNYINLYNKLTGKYIIIFSVRLQPQETPFVVIEQIPQFLVLELFIISILDLESN